MLRKFKCLILLFLCITTTVCAQNSASKKAQDSFDDAQQYLRQNIYDEGIKYLEEAVKADPKFQMAYIQLGDVYRRLRNQAKAKENYQKAVQSPPTIEPRIYFVLGESQ